MWKTRKHGTQRQKGKKFKLEQRGKIIKSRQRKLSRINTGLTKKERSLLKHIENIASIKGYAQDEDVDIKRDSHGGITKKNEVLFSLVRKGYVYPPREGLWKPTGGEVTHEKSGEDILCEKIQTFQK